MLEADSADSETDDTSAAALDSLLAAGVDVVAVAVAVVVGVVVAVVAVVVVVDVVAVRGDDTGESASSPMTSTTRLQQQQKTTSFTQLLRIAKSQFALRRQPEKASHFAVVHALPDIAR